MSYTLNSFAASAREILQADNTPAGREKLATLLRSALLDRAFVESQFDAQSPERKIVYEDPDLGFCILAHRYTDERVGPPHDHGHSWAIYGQADGETVMSDWEQVTPGKIRKVREYTLTPGVARLYNEGDIHAPSRSGPNRLIRIEGTNMERVKRTRFDLA